MSHGQQNSTIPTFKLSPNVAAFVPGVSYAPSSPSASSNHVTSNSNLSPLVPEFYPSVLYDHTAAPPYKAVHASGYHDNATADFQHETPVQQQQQQKKLASSSKKTKVKSEKLINESKGEESSTPGEQTLSTSTRTQKTGKAKSKRGKKGGIEDTNPHQNQKALNEGSSGGGRQATGVLKDEFSSKICENLNVVSYRENAQKKQGDPGLEQSSGAQKVKLNPQSKEGASLSEKSSSRSTFTHKGKHAADEVEERHHTSAKTLDTGHHTAPTFAVSYSDKVKSLATCNKTQNDNLSSDTSESWVKDFSPSYSKDVKHRPVQESCGIGDRKYNSTVLDHSSKRGAKTVRTGTTSDRTKQSSEKTQNAMDKSKYRELHTGASSHSNLQQFTQRTGRTKESCDHFKKMSCDNDVNWRQRQDDSNTSRFGELDRKEQSRKVDSKEHNTNFPTKRNSQAGAQDSNKQETQVDHKHVKPFHHHSPATEEKKPAQQYSSKASLNSSVDMHSNMKPDNRTCNPPELFKETKSSSATPYKSKELSWDFPDLTDSVKMKKNSGNEIRAANVEERADVFFTRHVTPLSYSAALKSAPQPRAIPVSPFNEGRHPSAQRGLLKVPHPTRGEDEHDDQQEETKGKKKKKKKKKKNKDGKEKAAEGGSPRRTERGIAFDLGEMLQTITVQHGNSPERKQSGKKVVVATGVLPTQLSATSPTETNPSVKVAFTWKKEEQSNFKSPHNTLDSTAPVIKRGKERETPARKKPSALKKIILKEREEKKKAREPKDETCEEGDENGACVAEDENVVQPEEEVETSVTEDSSGLTLSDDVEPSPMDQQIAAEIHSRRFREYCFQVPDKEVDAVATELLKELVRFQDRQFHKDPVKAKAKRRFVLGLREVNKHLKLRKLKCVIISSNVERIKSAGGLDDTLSTIISVCQENKVPLVFALKRQVLGKVLCKKVPVSIVGIFNYDGAQEHFKSLIELTEKTRQAYTEKWQETREKLQSREKEAVDSGTFETTDEGHETGKSLVSEETLDELKTVDGSYPADSDNSGGEEDDDDDDKDVIIEDDLEIVNVESTEYFDNQD